MTYSPTSACRSRAETALVLISTCARRHSPMPPVRNPADARQAAALVRQWSAAGPQLIEIRDVVHCAQLTCENPADGGFRAFDQMTERTSVRTIAEAIVRPTRARSGSPKWITRECAREPYYSVIHQTRPARAGAACLIGRADRLGDRLGDRERQAVRPAGSTRRHGAAIDGHKPVEVLSS